MKPKSVAVGLIVGVTIGVLGTAYCLGQNVRRAMHLNNKEEAQANLLQAGNSDRFEDYVMCTGAVSVSQRAPTDGLWLLDYRAGKLLGTVIDRTQGKIVGWAELNLVQDFQIPPKQAVHFMMTTGNITQGQSALYVTETTTGKFGIYTMGPDPSGQTNGLVIRKHDMGNFRNPAVRN